MCCGVPAVTLGRNGPADVARTGRRRRWLTARRYLADFRARQLTRWNRAGPTTTSGRTSGPRKPTVQRVGGHGRTLPPCGWNSGDHVGAVGASAGAILQAHRRAPPDSKSRRPHHPPGGGTAGRAPEVAGDLRHRMPFGEIRASLLTAEDVGGHDGHHNARTAVSYGVNRPDPRPRYSRCGIVPV